MKLRVIDGTFCVCQLEAGKAPPAPQNTGQFYSITTTGEEISIVCEESQTPDNCTRIERGYSLIKIDEILDFSLVGILSRIAGILAEQQISIFALSTYNTDYILLQKVDLKMAAEALSNAGYQFIK